MSLRATPAPPAFSLRVALTGLGDSGLVFVFFFFLIFIYLAVLGLNCDTRDSIIAAHELLVAVCGI